MDSGKDEEKPKFDLNAPAEESSSELGFHDSFQFGSFFPERHTGSGLLVHDSCGGSSSTCDLRGMEREPDDGASDSPTKKMRYTIEEKGKSQIDHGKGDFDFDSDLDLNLNFVQIADIKQKKQQPKERISRRREETERQREIAKHVAQRFAHLDPEEHHQEKKKELSEVDGELCETQSPFSLAIEAIKKRNSSQNVRNKSSSESLSKWVPTNNKGRNALKRNTPKLLDLSLNVLAKYADAIQSLEVVPDVLRHKLSRVVCNYRKMDAHFLELLARGSPTEIRVRDISGVTEEKFAEIFGACDTKDLTVLQLNLCGQCMPDYILRDTLASLPNRLPALATISLRGAHRLLDSGLTALAESAPALQSINLSQCSLLTSGGIRDLISCFESTLRELYIDDCQNIDAMVILPALKKLKHLEVLSVAGIQTVRDDFVVGIVEVCGINMKELVLANCVELTDISLKMVGRTCPKLLAFDISYLHNLTDSALHYLANGCQSIQSLKLCRNRFSDEATAAFLEVSGASLNVLSLNSISTVAFNTALSIAKCSRNLLSLDLSWCRKLTDEALGMIVDSCTSLKLLKLFGCTQITGMFLNGHSNSEVQIIGSKMKPFLDHLNVVEPRETPLRYSSLTTVASQHTSFA